MEGLKVGLKLTADVAISEVIKAGANSAIDKFMEENIKNIK